MGATARELETVDLDKRRLSAIAVPYFSVTLKTLPENPRPHVYFRALRRQSYAWLADAGDGELAGAQAVFPVQSVDNFRGASGRAVTRNVIPPCRFSSSTAPAWTVPQIDRHLHDLAEDDVDKPVVQAVAPVPVTANTDEESGRDDVRIEGGPVFER